MMLHHLTPTATDPTPIADQDHPVPEQVALAAQGLLPARLGRSPGGWDVLGEANRIGNAE